MFVCYLFILSNEMEGFIKLFMLFNCFFVGVVGFGYIWFENFGLIIGVGFGMWGVMGDVGEYSFWYWKEW